MASQISWESPPPECSLYMIEMHSPAPPQNGQTKWKWTCPSAYPSNSPGLLFFWDSFSFPAPLCVPSPIPHTGAFATVRVSGLCENLWGRGPRVSMDLAIQRGGERKGAAEKKKKEEKKKKRTHSTTVVIGHTKRQKNKKKLCKTTAPRIPAWSPTVVLTGRHSG